MAPRVNTEDLIDARAVADLLGLKHRNTVSVYQSRHGDMPRPVVERAEGKIKLWLRPEVERWMATQVSRRGEALPRRAQGRDSGNRP